MSRYVAEPSARRHPRERTSEPPNCPWTTSPFHRSWIKVCRLTWCWTLRTGTWGRDDEDQRAYQVASRGVPMLLRLVMPVLLLLLLDIHNIAICFGLMYLPHAMLFYFLLIKPVYVWFVFFSALPNICWPPVTLLKVNNKCTKESREILSSFSYHSVWLHSL